MQQNGDLDEALAEFLGIQVTELPAGQCPGKGKVLFSERYVY